MVETTKRQRVREGRRSGMRKIQVVVEQYLFSSVEGPLLDLHALEQISGY